MDGGEAGEHLLPGGGQPDEDVAVVVFVLVAPDEAARLGPVNQFDGAVVAHLEPLSDVTDPEALVIAARLDREEELVLLRFESSLAGGVLAEAEEAPDGISEIMQSVVVGFGWGGGHG